MKRILLWFGLYVGLYCLYFEVVEFSPEVVPWQSGVVLHYFQVSNLLQKWFFSLFSLTKHAINFSDRASELGFNFWKLDFFFSDSTPFNRDMKKKLFWRYLEMLEYHLACLIWYFNKAKYLLWKLWSSTSTFPSGTSEFPKISYC